MSASKISLAAITVATLMAGAAPAWAQSTQITMWSNWPDEPAKKDWVTARVKDFEAANKSCSVKLSFIPKADLYTQAKSAVRTVGTNVGKEILRGVLGGIMGSKKR